MKTLEKMVVLGAFIPLLGCGNQSCTGSYSPDVRISPEIPRESDNITCTVGYDGVFDFYWQVNHEEVYSSTGENSILSKDYTQQGDLIDCIVYTPESVWSDENWIGQMSVYVE